MVEPKIIVVVSDLHCGSLLGLTPPKFEDDVGIAEASEYRQWAWARWLEFQASVLAIVGKDPFMFILNGDSIEGLHHGGKELLVRSEARQVEMAVECLRPMSRRASQFVSVEGTECHDSTVADLIATRLGFTHRAIKWYQFDLNGLRHIVRHHTSVPGRAWTEAGAIANHLADDRMRRLRCGRVPTDVLIAAHRHTWSMSWTADGIGIATPSWQGVGRWARSKTREDLGSIGGVVLDYRGRVHRMGPAITPLLYSPGEDA